MKKGPACRPSGFTIVELLIILAVVSVLGVVLVDVFLRSIRGSDKARILAKLQQNGQVAMDNMDKAIRGSEAVLCPRSSTVGVGPFPRILMIVREGQYTRFRFKEPTSDQNGKVQIDYPNPSVDIFTNPSDEKIAIWESYCQGADAVPLDKLTDLTDASDNGVSISEGSFIKNKKAGFKDIVTIFFKVGPSLKLINQQAVEPVTFQTTVEVR